MKVINKTGFPIKIIENNKPREIPFDKKVYHVDDSCYKSYKDLFYIVKQPNPDNLRPKAWKWKKESLKKNKEKKVLGNKKINPNFKKLREFEVGNSLVKRQNKKIGRYNKYEWIFEHEDGTIVKGLKPKEFAKKYNYSSYQNLYTYANDCKFYRGWKSMRKNIDE